MPRTKIKLNNYKVYASLNSGSHYDLIHPEIAEQTGIQCFKKQLVLVRIKEEALFSVQKVAGSH